MFEESDGTEELPVEEASGAAAEDPRDRTAFSFDVADDEFAPRIALGRPEEEAEDDIELSGNRTQLGSFATASVEAGGARRDDRLDFFVGVHVTIGRDYFVALAGNISRGGLFVATHEEVEIGTIVWLEFLLPETDESLVVEAEVRWTREGADGVAPGFGVRFIDLEVEDHDRLRKLIEALKDDDEE